MAKETVLVASPNATASTPDASGSSVPACPAFWASKMRRTAETVSVDVTPIGLSTTTQPCTGAPLRLRAIVFVLAVDLEVALHFRGFENGFYFFGFGEGLVFDE